MELELITEIVSQVMKVDPKEVSKTTTLVDDLGADSLDLLRIVMNIEERFNIKLPQNSIYDIATVEDAANLVKKTKKA